jgi:hypothetical protein
VKLRTVIGLIGAMAASFVGMAALVASPAGAAAAITGPAGNLPFPIPLFLPLEPAGTAPNVKVTGNCPSWLFDPNSLALSFTSGHAVLYRGINASNDFPNGANAEGDAVLLVFDAKGDPVTRIQTFMGRAHAWFGQNGNANGQSYFGETVSFSGTATDGSGSTITLTANPGGVQPASGKPGGGWGQENLSCTIVSPVG